MGGIAGSVFAVRDFSLLRASFSNLVKKTTSFRDDAVILKVMPLEQVLDVEIRRVCESLVLFDKGQCAYLGSLLYKIKNH